jgi:CTP:molybdopterin cytidylyltransferase MocA
MSVKRGFGAPKPRRAEGVPVMLADIPNVTAGHLTKLIGAFRTAGGQAIERAASQGRRGNPVMRLRHHLAHARKTAAGGTALSAVIKHRIDDLMLVMSQIYADRDIMAHYKIDPELSG